MPLPQPPRNIALPHIDRDDTLEMEEKHGVIVSLKRRVRVTGLKSTDYSVLLNGLVQAGIPECGEYLVPIQFREESKFGMLVLVKRLPKLVPGDTSAVDIDLEYEVFIDNNNQQLPAIDDPTYVDVGYIQRGRLSLYGKSKTSVQQTKTNFYNPPPPAVLILPWADAFVYIAGSIVDYNGIYWIALVNIGNANAGNVPPRPGPGWRVAVDGVDFPVNLAAPKPWPRRQVVVGHRFPTDEKDGLANQTRFQTGEITIMQPQIHYRVSVNAFVAKPWNLADDMIGKINFKPWMNKGRDEWMCMEVEWEAIFLGAKYAMQFEFQHNPDAWQPTAVFFDSRTGRPPPNLVQDFGVRTIPYHTELDFNQFLNALFESRTGV